MRRFFRFPFDTNPFRSVINNSTWREDRVFTEMRLAGINPMCIQRVTTNRVVANERKRGLTNRLAVRRSSQIDIRWTDGRTDGRTDGLTD
ncbi:hypothetical protein QZH41_002008 [Actinostola sp. cb2023]|nr:hypothetical protein QZH41_002008 [Actinostola sp. cb2023]